MGTQTVRSRFCRHSVQRANVALQSSSCAKFTAIFLSPFSPDILRHIHWRSYIVPTFMFRSDTRKVLVAQLCYRPRDPRNRDTCGTSLQKREPHCASGLFGHQPFCRQPDFDSGTDASSFN